MDKAYNENLLSHYKHIIDNSFIVSKTTKLDYITYVNDSFVKTSGYSREELIGHI